jgi:hypothetical protein
MNSSGKIVLSKSVTVGHRNESMSFDISGQASGVYIARVVSEEGIQTAKVLLVR